MLINTKKFIEKICCEHIDCVFLHNGTQVRVPYVSAKQVMLDLSGDETTFDIDTMRVSYESGKYRLDRPGSGKRTYFLECYRLEAPSEAQGIAE